MSRNHVPCRECGTEHRNPRSSSLCCSCGEKAADANRVAEAQARDRALAEVEDRRREFENAETVHELKEWIREHLAKEMEL